MISFIDQLFAAVDCDGAADIANIRGKTVRGSDDRLGRIVSCLESRQMKLDPTSTHFGTAQQFQKCFIKIRPAVINQKFPNRAIAPTYGWISEPGPQAGCGSLPQPQKASMILDRAKARPESSCRYTSRLCSWHLHNVSRPSNASRSREKRPSGVRSIGLKGQRMILDPLKLPAM